MSPNPVELLSFENPAFRDYVFWTSVLVLKMILMAGLTGYHRIRTNTYPNAEDAVTHSVPVRFGNEDVERTRRAHRNDLEFIPIYLIIGLLYVLSDPSAFVAAQLFRAAAMFRILHTIVYAVYIVPQPARGICFAVPAFITGYMMLRLILITL